MSERKAADSSTLAAIRDWAKALFYKKPSTGIPENDLSSDVQQKLNAGAPTIDSELSDSSTNPVQNKVVKGAIDAKYTKPSSGIPKSDLVSAVQTSLDKADTALQSHQSLADYVKGPSSSVDTRVAVFNGTGGKTLKDSGFTIGKSVPSDAKFTDTTYESKSAASGGTAVSLVTTGEKYTWNNKGSYSKPSGGIPKTDLASGVQTSLGLADTALQSHQDISGKVNGPSSATDNNVVIFDGTTGKIVKDSGFTIEKSVPSNAVFTDTNTKVTSVGNHYTPTKSATKSASGASGTSGTTVQVVTGVEVDAAGHVTGVVSGAATDTTYESKAAASGGTAVSLVTTGEKYTWNSKGSYSKPSGGIPKTDLADAVQTSLGKADTAVQDVSGKADKATTLAGYGITDAKIANGVITLGGNTITPLTAHQSLAAYVKGPASSVNNRVAIFDGTGGKTIKDSGYTIAKSVPSDAVFTDTTYESKSASSGGTAVSLVTTGEKYTWNNKGSYSKPSGGIPKTDLASAVQTSLGKADTALQSHQDISGKADVSETGYSLAVSGKTVSLKNKAGTVLSSITTQDTTYSAISDTTINNTFV